MKVDIFKRIEKDLQQQGFEIVSYDDNKPWGGFFVINEAQAQKFADTYFDGQNIVELQIAGKLSPKILVVEPQKRLSWQYHFRRAEIWRVVSGTVGVVASDTDEENNLQLFNPDNTIILKKGKRHRLIGLNDWGVIAEIWQHTDIDFPSDEDDIVRLQDDFGR
ncbi:alginate biosynthesis protein AlgA [Pedobacter glucosidilyticus]|nr:phosphoheptose isomerase [Pedobacter glucosidilyticus]KHJ36545.1 alginate biosynthesis protein AlgA [Pedobacter glucosidilyticus]